MAITSNTYTGNGSNKLFSITFPYLDTTDIDVYLNGVLQTVTTQYTFANATTVEFVAAPGAGTTVLLSRSSDDSTLQATFFPGSSIKANDLNDNFDQVLYLAQETNNNVANAVAGQIPAGTITDLQVNAAANINATKLSFTQSGTGATARTVDSKLKDVVSVKDFGAVGDGIVDDTVSIQAAINAVNKGVLYFPPGNYKTTASINITKNGQNDSTQSNFEIQATGAKIVCTLANALRITQTKRFTIVGLEISAPYDANNASVFVTGMWFSKWINCNFGDVAFTTAAGLQDFDQAYWNKFERCSFQRLIINTGSNASRYEFNANTFDTCVLWGGDYAIMKYGSHSIEDVVFINCDISYQSAGILYVDEATYGNLTFVGGYFDSAAGFPSDLKGLTVDFIGRVWNPNDANVSAFRLPVGSNLEAKGIGGTRSGSRYPVSSQNLIINGDLRGGTSGISTSNAALALQSGSGLFGQYVRITSSTAFGSAAFSSIALPFTGTYTLTVIGKVTTGGSANLISNGISNAINLDSDWTVDSFTFSGTQGTQPNLTIQNGASGSMSFDIAYVGLTFGGIGQLSAPIHPTADRFSYPYAPIALSGSKATTSQAASIATVAVGNQTNVSFMVRAMFVDSSYPQYNATCVYLFSGMTPNGRPTVASLTQLQAHASGLDISAVPVITSSVAGSTVTVTASVSPGSSGEATVSYEITNIFNPAGNTITLL
jgi:hypothetical protein